MRIALLISVLVLTSASCRTTSSQRAFEAELPSGYRVLPSPRSDDGAGTLVRFENKDEIVVASSDTLPCLKRLHPRRSRVILPTTLSFEAAKRNGGAKLPRLIADYLDFSIAFEDSQVHVVVAEAHEPFQDLITEAQLSQFLNDVAGDDDCTRNLYDRRNKMIMSAIGAESLRYMFYDEKGSAIALAADVAAKLTADFTRAKFNASGTALIANEPMLFGAREIWACEVAGCDGLTSEQRRQLRTLARTALGEFADARLVVAPDISDRLVKRIAATGITEEGIILFYDTSRSKNDGRGILITAGRLYWGVMPRPSNRLSYENASVVRPGRRGIHLSGHDIPLRSTDNTTAAEAIKRVIAAIKEQRKAWGLAEP